MDSAGPAGKRRYPPLARALELQLERIEPSGGLYRPCVAILKDGTELDRVYFAEAQPWFAHWGVWPDEDRAKRWIDVRSVAAVRESRSRLPAQFAEQLYEAGESGMGYMVFTVRFRDGSSVPFVAGNAVDFIRYPAGQSAATVAEVIPHAGRDGACLEHAPDYHWCLYSPAG